MDLSVLSGTAPRRRTDVTACRLRPGTPGCLVSASPTATDPKPCFAAVSVFTATPGATIPMVPVWEMRWHSTVKLPTHQTASILLFFWIPMETQTTRVLGG